MRPYLSLSLIMATTAMCAQEKKPNVLFIMVDDLRPVLGTYGYPDVLTPNIDKLASEGVQFNHSFCNVPVCGASRASILTGLRPHYPQKFVNHTARIDQDSPGTLTIPEHFRNNGYTAISNGKISHFQDDNAQAWSEPPWRPSFHTYIPFMNVDYADSSSWNYYNPKSGAGPYFESADVDDTVYFDGKLAMGSIEDLKRFAENGEPFIMGVGFRKPHLPFNAPKKYFDLYDQVKIADNRFPIKGLPPQVKNSAEIMVYGRMEQYNTEEWHYEARKAYYACVSFVDAQVGLLMQALDELRLKDNTIVVLIGDHGWNLGEHNFWGKHNILYNALHAPLIIKANGIQPRKVDEIVEYLDIYPTLCDLAGLEKPAHLQGESMINLMKNKDENWNNNAISEWAGARTILTPAYSYSMWFEEKNKGVQVLFDHQTDPQENENVADNPSYSAVVKQHKEILDEIYSEY